MGNIWATQKDFGGLKWLFVICSAYASQVADPFSPVPLRVVGSNGYLSFARLAPRKWSTHFSPVPSRVVGSNGLEPSTSRLSGVCSNQLSYEPIFLNLLRFWWRQAGSNRWPPACRAGALPAELCPHYSFLKLLCGKHNTFVVSTAYKTNAPKHKVRSTRY